MKIRIWLALLAVYIFWGSTYLAIRFAVESIPPFTMAAARHLIAGLILLAWMRIKGTPMPNLTQWRTAAVVGLFLLLGGNGLVVWAEQYVVSGVAALIVGSMPLWIVMIDRLRPGGTSPAGLTVVGILVGFLGIIYLINPFDQGDAGKKIDLIGAGALIAAAFLWAIGSIFGREHIAQLPGEPLLTTSMEMLTGGAGLLLVGALAGEWNRLDASAITTSSLLGLAYLIVFGSLVAFSAFSWLIGVAPTPLVSTYAYVNPLVAIILGNLIAQEPITPRVLISALVIIGAVVLINTSQMMGSRKPIRG